MRKWEMAGLSMVQNHCIAASKGVSEGKSWTSAKSLPGGIECDLINWPLGE